MFPATQPTLPRIHTMVWTRHSTSSLQYLGTQVSHQLTQIPVFAGKDASRALAQSSLKLEDCRPEWQDLPEKEKGVLRDWFTFFSKRYNIVGKVQL